METKKAGKTTFEVAVLMLVLLDISASLAIKGYFTD